MKLAKLTILFATLGLFGLGMSACEVTDEEDTIDTVQTDAEQDSTEDTTPDTTEDTAEETSPDLTIQDTTEDTNEDIGQEAGEDLNQEVEVSYDTSGSPYLYVRIDDLSEYADTPDGGADIDALILKKSDGSQYFATSVEGFIFGNFGSAESLDPMDALGAPDAFYNYSSDDTSVCTIGTSDDRPFVSLGGEGGVLVVRMGAAIETGDTLTVLEVGGCNYGDGEAIVEEISVQISVSYDIDSGQWVALGSGEGPEISFVIPTL